MQIDSNFSLAHWDLATTFAQKKMYPEAVAEWQTALTLSGNPALAVTVGEAYRVSGFQGFLQNWIDNRPKNQLAGERSYQAARLFALLGKKNEVVQWLQKAFTAREGGMVYLKCDPVFDPLRSDPAFQAIVQKMNLSE